MKRTTLVLKRKWRRAETNSMQVCLLVNKKKKSPQKHAESCVFDDAALLKNAQLAATSKMKAELFNLITTFVQSNGMTIKDAVAKAQSQLGNQSKLESVVRSYGREKQTRQMNGDADLGHGNAMFTTEEELAILGAVRGFANERNAGSPQLVVDVVKAMGALQRWERAGQQNDDDTLRERARVWAKSRLEQVWRPQGLVKTTTGKPVVDERNDVPQQLKDCEAFFRGMGREFNAQGNVVGLVEKKNRRTHSLTAAPQPNSSVYNLDEFIVDVTDNTTKWQRIVDIDTE